MKKILLVVVLALCSYIAQAQISRAAYFDGYWSSWSTASTLEWEIRGGYSGFIIYPKDAGPWDPWFKFTINNYNTPDSRERNYMVKANQWYEYTGTVEYYISDEYPSAYAAFKASRGPAFVNPQHPEGRPTKKIVSRATIKIAPYKDHPKVYNLFYDNVGLGIDLNNLSFK